MAEFTSKSVDKLQIRLSTESDFHPTLNEKIQTTDGTRSPLGMILFFTSEKCTWCDVVKSMLEEEIRDFGIDTEMYEVDIDRHQYIAEAYGVMMVPTLVTGNNTLSGVPTETDLRTFILQAFPGVSRMGDEPSRYRVMSGMQDLLRSQRLHNEEKRMQTLNH